VILGSGLGRGLAVQQFVVSRAVRRVGLSMLLLLAACSSDPSSPKPSSLFATPDWAKDSSGPTFSATVPTGQALVGPDGRCTAVDPAGGAEIVAGGIALDMSECDVVRRAGPVDNVEIGTSPRGERATALTYMRGERPGIYRFLNGRLTSIERGPEPPPPPKPEKPQRKKPAKKPAKPVASG
jgi:hypothetical protein